MSECRLILGDCLDVLPTLDKASIAAVLADPPYGIAYAHSRSERVAIRGDDRIFDPSPWLPWPCVLWGADHYAARLPAGGTWLAWDKSLGCGPEDSFADCEFAWCSIPKIKRNICRYLWKGIVSEKAGEDNGRRFHPTQKPIGLMWWCLGLMKLSPGATVLDPYMGSGTVGLACMRLGFNYIGIEINPEYHAIAHRRLAEVCKPDLFGETHLIVEGQPT